MTAIRREKIETFVIFGPDRDGFFTVRDTDKFNDWGDYKCPKLNFARAWAQWAHNFKTGRTFSEFNAVQYGV